MISDIAAEGLVWQGELRYATLTQVAFPITGFSVTQGTKYWFTLSELRFGVCDNFTQFSQFFEGFRCCVPGYNEPCLKHRLFKFQ